MANDALRSDRLKPDSMIRKVTEWARCHITRRRLWRTAQGLLAILLLSAVLCYWLMFVRITNGGLKFENELLIPDQLVGTLVGERRQFRLTVDEGVREFLTGRQTTTYGVNGPYLGPTLRLRRGEDVDLFVENQLGETTTMHWHGMHVPASMDGTPHQKIEPGETWTASFQVDQQAASMWYHPHPHGNTGRQSYFGIAGFLLIDDENSESLELPKTYGVDDIPILIQDRLFEDDGEFRFALSRGAVYGNSMLINGTWSPQVQVEARRIRFRLLNGSNARIYYIGFDDNREFHQIATDGGFLDRPLPIKRLVLAPGERAEVLVDFSSGSSAIMKSYPEAGLLETAESFFDGAGTGHLDLLKIVTKPAQRSSHSLPKQLNRIERIDASLAAKVRPMRMGGALQTQQPRGRGQSTVRGFNGPPINGKRMDMSRIDERVRLGDVEIWDLFNQTGQPHPFHVHLVQFQILDRDGRSPVGAELGWKDTVLVHPNEHVRVIMPFERYADPKTPYMYHCHIMEHEDGGMMGQFLVVEEPDNLSLVTGQASVVLFVIGLGCEHCYEQVCLFDQKLRDAKMNLVIVTPDAELGPAKVADLSSAIVSDPRGNWAGWLGLPAHSGPAHGTVIIDRSGEVAWSAAGRQPYMDVDDVIRRVQLLSVEN